ncbi:MAG: MFS transporter [Acidimicrobiales bacterium]
MTLEHQPETAGPRPPDGLDSPRAWLVAASAFLSTFTVFGVTYSFGAFFKPMADEFGTDRSTTALFFSITTFLYFAIGVVTGKVADARGPRPVLLVGAVCMVAGLVATSRVDSIELGFVTYGLGVGIGVACAYVPMVSSVGAWFERRRTTALGVAVAGIGVGTLVVAPLAESLISRYGWRRSYVILAVGVAVLLAVASVGAHRPERGAQTAPAQALSGVLRTSRPFWILYGSMFLLSATLFVPFVFLDDYLETEAISGSAGWLVGLIGMSSVAGRLMLGRLAARWSSLRLYRTCIAVNGASFLIWVLVGHSYVALLAFAVVMGVSYGGFIALAPAVAAELFGTIGLGAILGALYTSAGIGGLIGPPLMGRLIDAYDYTPTLVIAMVLALVAAAVLLPLERRAATTGA